MARERRADSFLFEPTRYRNDPAVLGMSDAARGCYSMLFAAGWDMPEPGVFPDDDRVLAQLAMTSPENWAAVKAEVMKAFDTTSRPCMCIQKGLVATWAAQKAWLEAKSRRGKKAAKSRWSKGKDTHANALQTQCERNADGMPKGLGLGVDSKSESKEASSPLRYEDAPQAATEGPPRDRKAEVRALIVGSAKRISAVPERFPNDVAWDWLTQTIRHPDPRGAMGLMAWLWKSGTHDLEAIQRMILEVQGRTIENAYAYFSKNGDARNTIADTVSINRAESETARQNAEDAAWLAKR